MSQNNSSNRGISAKGKEEQKPGYRQPLPITHCLVNTVALDRCACDCVGGTCDGVFVHAYAKRMCMWRKEMRVRAAKDAGSSAKKTPLQTRVPKSFANSEIWRSVMCIIRKESFAFEQVEPRRTRIQPLYSFALSLFSPLMTILASKDISTHLD